MSASGASGGPSRRGFLASGRSRVDRVAHRRTDPEWVARAWERSETRVLDVSPDLASALPVTAEHRARLAWRPSAEVTEWSERYLLGVLPDGSVAFAVDAVEERSSNGPRRVGLRDLGPELDDLDAELAVAAVALRNWHAAHPRCTRCGAPTVVESEGWLRRCPSDGSEHYPRTDPAVIMLVTDDEDRALLGRHVSWPEGRYSTLAGFVEPGETLESAVAREVAEEVQVTVGEARYVTSQPWPFPASLMLGFRARALGGEPAPDGTELADARWFTRQELREGLDAQRLRLPPPISVARRLVEDWYGEPLGDASW